MDGTIIDISMRLLLFLLWLSQAVGQRSHRSGTNRTATNRTAAPTVVQKTAHPDELGPEAKIGLIVCGSALLVVFLVCIGLYFLWFKKKQEVAEALQLTKYYSDVKSRMSTSVYVFERSAWCEYLQFLQQKELRNLKHHEPLHSLLDDEENTFDFTKLKREAARLIAVDTKTAWLRGKKAAKSEKAMLVDYLCRIRDPIREQKDEKEGGLITVDGCRFEKLQNRKETQVLLADPAYVATCLHMTKLLDYYGFPLILCQAPAKKQFAAHWEAIWQEKVGVVVWIGGLIEERDRKIDEYIPLTDGGKCACGPFHIRTMMAAKIKGGYHAYRVQARKDSDLRDLVFIHVHMWPDHEIPKEPANLADLVWQIQGHQLRQNEKGLPCLMIHCSLGVQRSPAMVAAYIGRQMWMANKRVNVLGILRYIRRHRWKAFSMGNPFAQVQIIFGVLQVIAARSLMEGINPLHHDAKERRVFDHSMRRADAQESTKSLTIRLGQ